MGNKRKWIILYFIILTSIGAIGFRFIGGNQWSWVDSLYMTIITLSTVGYGEVHLLTNGGKIWSILLIIFGVSGIGALIQSLNEEFIQLDLFRKKNMIKEISKLRNHFIICGYGRMGAVIAKELKEKNLDFVIIENNKQKIELIRSKGMFCVNGDPTLEKPFQNAMVDKATGVAVVLDKDQDNLFVTMSLKTLNPSLFVLSRCAEEDNKSKLIRAGANKVINPYTAGGHRIAEMLSKPQVEDSISLVSPKHSDLNLVLDEISFEGLTRYDGIKIKESQIREEFDINIVGVIKSNGESIINPSPETILSTKDLVLLMGDASKLDKFKDMLPG